MGRYFGPLRQLIDERKYLELFLVGMCALAAVNSFVMLALSWHQPILDIHAFRQTQTAISADWMTRGGPWFGYATPVLGAPWRVPFEFPLYQWLIAVVHMVSGVSIDQAGRLVSWLFFVGTLPLLDRTMRRLGGDRVLSLIVCTLLLASPIYLFGARAVFMESAATFLSVLFCWGVITFLQGEKPRLSIAMMVVGAVLAALVKITTFVGFAAAGGFLVIWFMAMAWRRGEGILSIIRLGAIPGAVILVTLAVLELWLGYSDALKAQNPLGAMLSSAALNDWNFGSWAQRKDPELWRGVVFGRTVTDTLGAPILFWILLGALLAMRRVQFAAAAMILLYIIPFLVFTNLHEVHNYYQFANAGFLLAAAGIFIWGLILDGRARVAAAVFLVVVVVQVREFRMSFYRAMVQDESQSRTMQLSSWLKSNVAPDDVIVVFGYDWSSEVAYYSGLRAVMVPAWATPKITQSIAEEPLKWSGGAPIGAVVDCLAGGAPSTPVAEALTRARRLTTVAGCKVYR